MHLFFLWNSMACSNTIVGDIPFPRQRLWVLLVIRVSGEPSKTILALLKFGITQLAYFYPISWHLVFFFHGFKCNFFLFLAYYSCIRHYVKGVQIRSFSGPYLDTFHAVRLAFNKVICSCSQWQFSAFSIQTELTDVLTVYVLYNRQS